GGGSRLAHESLDRDGLGMWLQRHRQCLQREELIERYVSCRPDDTHTAAPNDALEPVLAGDEITFVKLEDVIERARDVFRHGPSRISVGSDGADVGDWRT